ncbi:MAG: hypothetical protein ACOVRB_12085 [Akkermansiaceae bacterium]
MIRTLTLIALAATAMISSSCCFCCTSDSKAPSLKRLPKFRNFPTAPASTAAPEVSYEK